MSNVIQISSDDFQLKVLESSIPVLADFGSKTCGVCLANAPAVEDTAREYESEVLVVKIDVELAPDIASSYGVRTLPTLLMFKDGQVVDRAMGHMTRSNLSQLIEKHLGDGE